MKFKTLLITVVCSGTFFAAGYRLGQISPKTPVDSPQGKFPTANAPRLVPAPNAQPKAFRAVDVVLPIERNFRGERDLVEFESTLADLPLSELHSMLARVGKIYPLDKRQKYWDILFSVWGARAGEEACSAVNEVPRDYRQHLFDVALKAWAAADSPAAINWLKAALPESSNAHPTSGVRAERLIAITDGMIESGHPEMAASSIFSNQDFSESPIIATAFAQKWGERDIDAAIAWANTLPPGTAIRMNGLRGVVTAIGEEDVQLAFKYVAALSSPEERTMGYASVCSLMQNDGDVNQQLALFRSNPSDSGMDLARAMFVRSNIEADKEASLEVLNSISTANAKAIALPSALSALQNSAPGEAAALAVKNLPPADLLKTLPPILKTWAKTDAKSSLEFVQSLDLPEPQKNTLARAIGTPRK